MTTDKKLALVLAGGGARGAYEAGVLHYIRTQLPPEISRRRPFDILCGSSVGAINVCFLAATSHDLTYQGKMCYEFWKNVKQDQIYNRGVGSLTRLLGRSLLGIGGNLFRGTQRQDSSPEKKAHFKGLLDTSPFPIFLREIIPWKQIALNIQNGITKAISVTATNVHTGKVEIFLDKHPQFHYTGRNLAHIGPIELKHALASSAIPVFFPAARIGPYYYFDGGVRMNTPLSPAIHLGADKVLVIGLHHRDEIIPQLETKPQVGYDQRPTLGQMMGTVLKSVFLDRLDYDLAQLSRFNQIVEAGEKIYGPEFTHKMNAALQEMGGRHDVALRGISKREVLSIFPSQDIPKVFGECVEKTDFIKKNLKTFERVLLKILDVDIEKGLDFLTFIIFAPDFIRRLLELGFEDGRKHHDELVRFFSE